MRRAHSLWQYLAGDVGKWGQLEEMCPDNADAVSCAFLRWYFGLCRSHSSFHGNSLDGAVQPESEKGSGKMHTVTVSQVMNTISTFVFSLARSLPWGIGIRSSFPWQNTKEQLRRAKNIFLPLFSVAALRPRFLSFTKITTVDNKRPHLG